MTISSALLSAPRTPSSTASRMTVNASSRRVPTSLSSYAQQVKPRPVVAGARSMSLLGPARSNAPKHPGGLRGLVSNAGEIFKGFIPGIAHFVGDVATDTLLVPHLLFDAAKGDLKPSVSRYLPATTGIVKSFGRTAHDIVDPRRFIKAWDEGTLASKVLEDVGNVALVGGPIAKAIGAGAATSAMTASEAGQAARFAKYGIREATEAEITHAGLPEIASTAPEGAAGELARAGAEPRSYYTQYRGMAGRAAASGDLERAATLNQLGNRVRNVVSLGEQFANAPARPYTKLAEYIGQGAKRTGLSEAVTARLPGEVRTWLGQQRAVRETLTVAGAARTRLTRQTLEPVMLSKELGLTAAEDKAALLALDIPPEILKQTDHLGDQDLADVLNDKYQDWEGSQRPTVDDARVASKYVQGTLPVERMESIGRVTDSWRKIAEDRKVRAIAEGLHPEQLGNTLRQSEVDKATEHLLGKRAKGERVLSVAEARSERATRLHAAQEAAVAELPEPPVRRVEQAAGRKIGLEEARDRAQRREHRKAVRDLDRAVNEYVKLSEGGAPRAVQRAAARLDDLVDKAEGLRREIETRARRGEAASGLGRATGGIEAAPVRPGPLPGPVTETPAAFRARQAEAQVEGTLGELAALNDRTGLGGPGAPERLAGPYRPTTERPGPAQYRQQGRLAGDLASARRAAGENARQTRLARRGLNSAESEAARAQELAGGRMETAAEQMAATTPLEGPRLGEVAVERGPWARTAGRTQTGEVTAPLSPAERAVGKQATLAERARVAQQHVAAVQRGLSRIDEQIANVESELQRSFQERFHTDVNLPSITRLTNAMFHGTARLPTLLRRFGLGDIAKAVADGDIAPAEVAQRLDGIDLTDAQRAQLEHSVTAEAAVAQIAHHLDTEAPSVRLNSPYRVKDIIDATLLPDTAWPAVEKAWDNYLDRRIKTQRTVLNDQTKAMPAKYRRAAMDGQRQSSALMDLAERENRQIPGSGDEWLAMAEETMNTLQDMVDSGFDPVHLTGGPEVTPSSAAGRGFNQQRLTPTKQRAEHLMRTGMRELSGDAYQRVEAQSANRWVINKRNEYLTETLGKRIGDLPEVQAELAAWEDTHPGEVMPSNTLAKALRDYKDADGQKYRTIDPAATLTPDSTVVPTKVFEALEPPESQSMAMRVLGRTNRAFKTWVLPFSGRWQIGNAIGNVLQSSMHAGVSPLELGRIAHQIIKEEGGYRALWREGGLAKGLPRELSDANLTHAEMIQQFGGEEATPRNRVSGTVDKIARGSYKFNSTVDNLTRSSVYMAKLLEGQGSEAALRTTLRALGDYTRLLPFERNTIRQIFPFYSWLKHSMTATMRLPFTSPTRAAFYANLQNLYEDDPDLRKIIGQGFRVGNTGILDFGSVVPLADFGGEETPLNPINLIGASLSPTIKFPLAEVFGLDANSMDRLTRPGGQGAKERSFSPLTQFTHNPVNALWETAWQATQQGPTQIRSLRDLALGNGTRYSGTGYRSGHTNTNRRNLWQLARIASMPNVKYDPRLQEGTE